MLVLTRKSEQSVVIGSSIQVKILAIRGDQVSIGFTAPPEISIYRKEVYEAIQKENLQAVHRGQDRMQNLETMLLGHLKRRQPEASNERRDAKSSQQL